LQIDAREANAQTVIVRIPSTLFVFIDSRRHDASPRFERPRYFLQAIHESRHHEVDEGAQFQGYHAMARVDQVDGRERWLELLEHDNQLAFAHRSLGLVAGCLS
jgi:hypothetical protein